MRNSLSGTKSGSRTLCTIRSAKPCEFTDLLKNKKGRREGTPEGVRSRRPTVQRVSGLSPRYPSYSRPDYRYKAQTDPFKPRTNLLLYQRPGEHWTDSQ